MLPTTCSRIPTHPHSLPLRHTYTTKHRQAIKGAISHLPSPLNPELETKKTLHHALNFLPQHTPRFTLTQIPHNSLNPQHSPPHHLHTYHSSSSPCQTASDSQPLTCTTKQERSRCPTLTQNPKPKSLTSRLSPKTRNPKNLTPRTQLRPQHAPRFTLTQITRIRFNAQHHA